MVLNKNNVRIDSFEADMVFPRRTNNGKGSKTSAASKSSRSIHTLKPTVEPSNPNRLFVV